MLGVRGAGQALACKDFSLGGPEATERPHLALESGWSRGVGALLMQDLSLRRDPRGRSGFLLSEMSPSALLSFKQIPRPQQLLVPVTLLWVWGRTSTSPLISDTGWERGARPQVPSQPWAVHLPLVP